MVKHETKSLVSERWQIRPGEGHAVDVSLGQFVAVGGQSATMVQIDFRKAPVPERHYVADTCSVDLERGTVRMMFGQRRIGKPQLRSLLVLHMSPRATLQFLSSVDQIKDPSYQEIIELSGITAEKVERLDDEPPQTVALSANMVLTGISGDDACMDFYQASPFALAAAPHQGKLAIDPVVRVDLRSSIMFGLISEIRQLANQKNMEFNHE